MYVKLRTRSIVIRPVDLQSATGFQSVGNYVNNATSWHGKIPEFWNFYENNIEIPEMFALRGDIGVDFGGGAWGATQGARPPPKKIWGGRKPHATPPPPQYFE